jgi:hypothetical protein
MAHAQKPYFVFWRNGRVHLNMRGRQFSRLLTAEVCASAVVMLDTPCSEVVWRVLVTHSIRQFPLHFGSRASPCAITFQLESTTKSLSYVKRILLTEVSCIFIVSGPLEFPRWIWLPSETGFTVFSYRSTRDFCVLNEHMHWLEIYLLSRYSTISQWLIVMWFLLVDIWVDGLNESLQQGVLNIRSTEVEWYTCGEWETWHCVQECVTGRIF